MWIIYSVEEYPYEGWSLPEVHGVTTSIGEAKEWVETHATQASKTSPYRWSEYVRDAEGNVTCYEYSRATSNSNILVRRTFEASGVNMGPKDLDDAIFLATWAHKGQFDKAGEPYILHPMRVMMGMTTYDEKIVAILHDTVEDTDVTLDLLEVHGYPQHIIEAVDTLTHRDGENYEAYIERIKAGPSLAVRVKLRDLSDNMNKSRIPFPSERDVKRWEKYERAYARLTGE